MTPRKSRRAAGFGFVIPAVAVYTIFVAYPLVQGLWLSLTDSGGGPRYDLVGLDNYAQLLDDVDLHRAIGVTLLFALLIVVFQNLIGLLLARALFHRPKVRPVVSVLILMPALVSPIMASFIFAYLVAPDGAFNQILRAVGLDTLTRVWLGDPSTALGTISAINVWMYAGYSAAIFLAGYLALPQDVLDAADLDGARGPRRFFSVEWPLLAPSLTVNVTLSLIGALKIFELPFVLTEGGPAGSTTTLAILIYRKVFGATGEFAYGITIAVLLLVIVVVLSSLVTAVLRRREQRI